MANPGVLRNGPHESCSARRGRGRRQRPELCSPSPFTVPLPCGASYEIGEVGAPCSLSNVSRGTWKPLQRRGVTAKFAKLAKSPGRLAPDFRKLRSTSQPNSGGESPTEPLVALGVTTRDEADFANLADFAPATRRPNLRQRRWGAPRSWNLHGFRWANLKPLLRKSPMTSA